MVVPSIAPWLSSSPAGAGGAVMVPYLDGERTPNLPEAAYRQAAASALG